MRLGEIRQGIERRVRQIGSTFGIGRRGRDIAPTSSIQEVSRQFQIELVGIWPIDLPTTLRERVEEVISWQTPPEAAWFPLPGRTFNLESGGDTVKIKGAGFYNPGNVSFAGSKRTITPVPESPVPMPPIERLFERNLVHADPSSNPPHLMESVHSTFAPIGGMTLEAAIHDQEMFSRLTLAGIPANSPVASYRYQNLQLDGRSMGVSVSLLPHDALPISVTGTPYNAHRV